MPSKRSSSEDNAPHSPTRVEAVAAPKAQYDPTYFQRHEGRNRGRIEAIIENMTPGTRALDVGCNRGYFSRALLDHGLVEAVDAIEPSREQVDPALVADPRFSLHVGDAAEFGFEHRYHAVVYCAVHHHVFGHRGYNAAMQLFRKIVSSCDRFIFFETGHFLEGSRWYWQREMRKTFHSDEEHLGALLQAIGPRLERVNVIGRHRMNGVKRYLLRIDLLPADTPQATQTTAASADAAPALTPLTRYRRTVGWSAQQLVEVGVNDARTTAEMNVHEGTEYTLCKHAETGDRMWCKKCLSDPFLELREQRIAEQVDDPRFIRPVGRHPELGLVFPYVEGEKLSDVDLRACSNREAFLDSLFDIHAYARDTEVTPGELDLDPRERGVARKLIDVIDLNAANILVRREGDELHLAGVIDLEYFRNHNAARNGMHLARLVLASRTRAPERIRFMGDATAAMARHHVKWTAAPIESQLYEKYSPRQSVWTLPVREGLDRLLRVLPGHWQ